MRKMRNILVYIFIDKLVSSFSGQSSDYSDFYFDGSSEVLSAEGSSEVESGPGFWDDHDHYQDVISAADLKIFLKSGITRTIHGKVTIPSFRWICETPDLKNIKSIACSDSFNQGSVCNSTCRRHHKVNPYYGNQFQCGSDGWKSITGVKIRGFLGDYCIRTRCPTIKTRLTTIEDWNCTDGSFVGSECALGCRGKEYLVFGRKRIECEYKSNQTEPNWSSNPPICRARETFTMKKSIENISNFIGSYFNEFNKIGKLNSTLTMIEKKFTKVLDGRTPCRILFTPDRKMFRSDQVQISRTRWKKAILKRSINAAISPENAKKLFDLLAFTVDRFFSACDKQHKYHALIQKAYGLLLRAITRT